MRACFYSFNVFVLCLRVPCVMCYLLKRLLYRIHQVYTWERKANALTHQSFNFSFTNLWKLDETPFIWFSLNARKLLEAHKKETAQIISLIDISLRVPFDKAGLCGQNMLLCYKCSKTNRDFQVRVVWSVVEPSGIMMYFIKLDYNFRIHSSTACATISNFSHICVMCCSKEGKIGLKFD